MAVFAAGVGWFLTQLDSHWLTSQPQKDASVSIRPDQEMTLPELLQREQDLITHLRQLDTPALRQISPSSSSEVVLSEAAQRSNSTNSPPPSTRAETPKQPQTVASIAANPPTADMRGTGRPSAAAIPNSKDDIQKADEYLLKGQYTIARYLYEQAYREGDVLGALGMAKSYDGVYLKSNGLRYKGDLQKSRIWYRRASELSGRNSKDFMLGGADSNSQQGLR
nr:hypothetical protein [Methylobacterium sp. NI91]